MSQLTIHNRARGNIDIPIVDTTQKCTHCLEHIEELRDLAMKHQDFTIELRADFNAFKSFTGYHIAVSKSPRKE